MDITGYFKAAQAALDDQFHLSKHQGFYGLNFDEIDKRVLPFIGKLIWSHGVIRSKLGASMPPVGHRQEVMGVAAYHAELCLILIERETRGHDALSSLADDCRTDFPDADAPESWLNLGLSALVLELVMNHVRSLSRTPRASDGFHGLMGAMGRGFGLERAFALAEAGRGAEGKNDPRLKKAIAEFVPPCERLWGEAFINEAIEALRGRVGSRRDILRSAVNALDAAPGLPRDKWLYAEPHLLRLGPRFGIGWKTRMAVRAALKIV